MILELWYRTNAQSLVDMLYSSFFIQQVTIAMLQPAKTPLILAGANALPYTCIR